MAIIVAPGICRYTVNQTYGDQRVCNIIDMQIDTTGTPQGRTDAIYQVAGDIINNWADHIVQFQVAALSFDSVSWVDLDSLDGVTGARTDTSDTDLPVNGGTAETGMPGNAAILVTKLSGGGRRARNGRMYIAGAFESLTGADPNTFGGANYAGIQTALDDFLAGINDAEGPDIDIQRQMVVVHTVNDVYTGYDDVDRLVLNSRLATQRRRLRD